MSIKDFRVDQYHNAFMTCNIIIEHDGRTNESELQRVLIPDITEKEVIEMTEVMTQFCYNVLDRKGKINLTLYAIKEIIRLWFPKRRFRFGKLKPLR